VHIVQVDAAPDCGAAGAGIVVSDCCRALGLALRSGGKASLIAGAVIAGGIRATPIVGAGWRHTGAITFDFVATPIRKATANGNSAPMNSQRPSTARVAQPRLDPSFRITAPVSMCVAA
jgi:hypothetical protein